MKNVSSPTIQLPRGFGRLLLLLLLLAAPLLGRAGTPVLRFQATVAAANGVDVTAFVDQVEILNTSTGAVVASAVLNPGFETFGSLANGTYGYNPGGASWTFNNRSGIAANGSAFGPPTTAGSYVALLQTYTDGAGAISQTLPALPAGSYQVRVLLAQRNTAPANQGVAILVDGREVGRSVPTNDNAFHSYTTASFVVDAVLRLEGTVTTADVTAFADAIELLDASTGLPVAGTPVANASFETFTAPLSNSTFGYRPTGATWAFLDGSGIAASNSGFNNPTSSPAGSYVAFLQARSSITQVVKALSGSYKVRLQLAQRNTSPANQGVRVYLNEVLLGTFVPAIGGFQTFTTGSFTPQPQLVIDSFSPGSGPVGTSVVIRGKNFTGITAVAFNGTTTTGFTVNSDTQITVPVPAGATSGPISVTNGTSGATVTSTASFGLEYLMPAAITTCSGRIFDPAGYGEYTPNTNQTTTLTPATAGAKVRLTFGGFDLFDATLYIYDGPDTNSRLIGQFQYNRPNIVTATTAGGQLTLRFISGNTPSVDDGFDAVISCVSGTPNVSSFTPSSGAPGTSVIITGTDFTNATAVSFNGVAASFSINSATQITATVPTGSTAGRIFVSNTIGTGSSPTNFTPSAPVVSSFTPTSGSSGTSVVITGGDFSGATTVTFNGMTTATYAGSSTVPNFVVNSPTQITAQVPVGATTGPIRVTTPNGTGTSATSFVTDNFWFPPAITSCTGTLYNLGGPGGGYGLPAGTTTTTLTPATAGGKVRLTFAPNGWIRNAVVSFYDGPDTNSPLIASYNTPDPTNPTYFSPSPVTATSAGGQLTVSLASGNYYLTPTVDFNAAISCVTGTPNVSSFTPTSGGQGVSVVITGTNFTNATGVAFNGPNYTNRVAAPNFVVNSATQITVPVPAGAPLGRISVSNANGAGSSATNFTPLAPVISSFTPTSGTAGTNVVITGTSFTGTTAVAFNGVAAPVFVVNSPTQITVLVPAGVVAGPIRVTTTLGTGISSGFFGSDVILIGTAAVTTCSGNIYDSGGPNGTYGNNENLTTTISPGTPGAKVRLSLSGINIRGGSDALYVYDGSSQVGYFSYSQNGSTRVITATNPTGQLTLQFISGNTNYFLGGFAAAISCVNPTISSFTPTSGAAGTSVVITGTEFSGATAVTFNGVPAPGFVVNSDTQITVPVPAGNTNGPISVTAPYGTATSTASFTVVAPTLTAVSPFIGVPGSVVTLTGTNLTGTSSITFYGSAGQRTVSTGFSVNAAGTQITGVLVPAGAQSGPITATTGGGTTPVGTALFSRASVVAAGGSHTVAVRPDGSLWVWGSNANGQLGRGTTGGQEPSPVRVGNDNNWVSAAAGTSHTVAIRADGTLWAWGLNNKGQLGLGSTTNQNTPQPVGGTTWASASAGTSHTVAVRADGTLWTWGLNDKGQLGLGTNIDWTTPQPVVGVNNWISAAAGGGHTVAVRADGTLWTWGLNDKGQLGVTSTNRNTPQLVVGVTNWASVAAGTSHTTAVRADGTLYAWGNNASGQLGLGSTTSQNAPQLVGSSTNWMSAAAGDAHSLGVQADGSLWAWGSNANGQLGLGSIINQNTPQVVAALTSWASAAAGTSHSAGEQSCGAFWAWGLNTSGQVGDDGTTRRPSPMLIFNPISLLTFSPSTAGGYNPVTVTGTNLAGLTALTVNGVSALASVTNSTATSFTFVVPAGAPQGAGTVSVSAGCGSGSSTAFTVGPPSPLLNTLSRAAELPGQAVVLTGLNFTNGSTVSFGGVPAASVIYTSPTSLTAVVPVGATPGPSAVVVSNVNGNSPSSPDFEVLQVYRDAAASGCLTTASLSLTSTGAAPGNWQYLRLPGAGGAVVAAIEHTRNLGTVTATVSALGTATGAPVRDDANGRAYLDRSFTLTATRPIFTGTATTVRVRFFGLTSELARLAAVDANATLAYLKASQYSCVNENCTLLDNDPNGESRLLAAPATALTGADWFTAQVSVTDHFSEFYLTGAATALLAPSQAPTLTSVSPARNRPTAPLNANVALTFSQPLVAATAGNVRVFASQSGGQLVRGGNVTTSGNTITVNPARVFAPGERVFVTAPGTVQGTNGYSALPRVYEFTTETARAPATFLDPPTTYEMGGLSVNIAVGDLNGDGRLDVVTSDFYGIPYYSTPGVVVRFGQGNGQLGPSTTYGVVYPGAVTLGDVDGDGDLDIVVVATDNGNVSTGTRVTTRFNNGNGSFLASAKSTLVATSPTHAVLGDVDGDGDLDMLTAASAASVSYNDGAGTFTDNGTAGGITIPTTSSAADVALGDIDGDGDLDALIANGSNVSVRLNNGRGAFSGTLNVPMGAQTTKLAVGDVDGDGDLDLVTSSFSTGTLNVQLNNGNGTFGNGASYAVPFALENLALGDVDGDGDLDLVTAGQTSTSGQTPGQAGIRLNNGNGTFGGGSNFATGGYQAQLALGDVDGDGTLDLLTSHIGRNSGSVNGTPTFSNNELYIRLNTALVPTISSFTPTSGPAGTLVTLTGTNLTAVRGVRFGSSTELAPITVRSVNSLTVQVPVGAASGVLNLTTLRGAGLSTATAFAYTPRPAGLLATLSPAGPFDACALRTLTGTATSPAFATGAGLVNVPSQGSTIVQDIVVRPDGKLVLGGRFTTYDGATAKGIVQLNPDGSRDNVTFLTGTGFNSSVSTVALQADGKVLVGGDFTDYNGTAATRIIRLNTDGSYDATFATGTGFDASVQSIVVQPDGQILVGGLFATYNNGTTQELIRLNPNGSRDNSFSTGTSTGANPSPGFDGGVFSLALQPDGQILVGGQFTTYNTTSVGRLIRLSANGSYDATFVTGTGFNNTVNAITLQADGKVLVGGNFTAYNSTADQNRIARLHTNGSLDTGFATGTGAGAGFNNTVNAITLQADGQVLVGGSFTAYNSTVANRLSRLDTNGTPDIAFAAGVGFDLLVRSLAVQPDGGVVVGGNFTQYRSAPAVRLTRLLPDGSANTAPTAVSGATFTFSPGNTTANPLVTSTAGAYSVVASLNGETSAASNVVTLTACANPLPTLTVLSVPAELPGMPITLTGTGFTPGSTVSFGGMAAGSVTYVSPTVLTVVVPAAATPGSSAVVVTTAAGSSTGSPAFTVLAVYNGEVLDACTAAVPPTPSLNDGTWHYLLSSTGQVVAAYNYTGASLGTLAVNMLRTDPAAPVRQDAGNRYYLGRNWHLTASAGPFEGRTVNLRLYGLASEHTDLLTADPAATMTDLKATQYSGPNEDCQLANNVASGENRTLDAPASSPDGTSYFWAELAVDDHFSEFYLTGSAIPLPVELVRFTAEPLGADARLRWATASEKNNDRFEVEASTDGRTFRRIGQVAGHGSTTQAQEYQLVDPAIARYAASPVYYRLRQVDTDGSFHYSSVRTVAVNGKPELALFPNPTTGAATLTGATPGAGITVYDALGRVILTTTANDAGVAALVLPHGAASGLYVVRTGTKALRLTVHR